jgi:ADP-ribosyl-[dinitrogen reductase] hydrolase
MRRYVAWYRRGLHASTGRCFDIGNTVRAALERFERTGDPFAGTTAEHEAGNGSLMRLAPVALFHADDPVAAVERAADGSRTTHATPVAVDACRYFAAVLVAAAHGATKAELTGRRVEPRPGYWAEHPLHPVIAEIADGSFRDKEPPAIRGSGYAAHSLEAALWAFHRSGDFREGCLLAANLGEDADTTAAVYGQLAGAFHGEDGIPPEWRERLVMREVIEGLADRIVERLAEGGAEGGR